MLKFRQRNYPFAIIFRKYFLLEMGTKFGFPFDSDKKVKTDKCLFDNR